MVGILKVSEKCTKFMYVCVDDSLSALLERDMELLWKQLADSATCETNAISNLQVLTVWIWVSITQCVCSYIVWF